jgi:hypothetical protein
MPVIEKPFRMLAWNAANCQRLMTNPTAKQTLYSHSHVRLLTAWERWPQQRSR